MKEVYLYFRTNATLTEDDDSAQSCCIPLSSFKGMHPTSDTALTIFYTPQIRVGGDGQDGNVVNNDSIVLTVGANDHKDAITALSRLFAGAANGGMHHDGFIVVADDLSSTYAVAEVTGVGTITSAAALS